jgi:CO/xanthine dehydrogenase Mo-binding subunit
MDGKAQHAAERLGLPVERVNFAYGDTNLPSGTLAGGSSPVRQAPRRSFVFLRHVTYASLSLLRQGGIALTIWPGPKLKHV